MKKIRSVFAIICLLLVFYLVIPSYNSYSETAEEHIKQGGDCFRKGNYDNGIAEYEKAIELNPDFYDARWNRGLVLLFLGRLAQRKNPIF